MRSIVFRTPGHLDIRAITTFGINSKPNSTNPIGFFGTGLKYALAVIIRNGFRVYIRTGGKTYDFFKDKGEFRSKEFDFIVMVRKALVNQKTELPFTTELGKNWQLWQAFRELYSNTLDENGSISELPDSSDPFIQGEDHTCIVVDSDEFAAEYDKRDLYFLPDGQKDKTDKSVQIIQHSSKYIYYRGMRVRDLQKPSVLTYNILSPLELTEDRTAKYDFYVDHYIKTAISQCEDVEMIEAALTANKDFYESSLDYKGITDQPSKAFKYVVEALRRIKDAGTYFNYSARSYTDDHDPDIQKRWTETPLQTKLLDCVQRGDWSKFLEICRENETILLDWLKVAVVRTEPLPPAEEEVPVSEGDYLPENPLETAEDKVTDDDDERPF